MNKVNTIKTPTGVITVDFIPNPELPIDKKVMNLRSDILQLETQVYRMLHPKDSKGEMFLPPGNEIKFDFSKKKYNDMMYNLKVSLYDLENVMKLSEKINNL